MGENTEYLSFTFAPHILEDLGVNLYTSVAKALVEFVANAHDADSEWVNTTFDEDIIQHARDTLKADYKLEKAKVEKSGTTLSLKPLAERTLPDNVQIVIEDNGCGMSRTDLESKFLVIGRRRRKGHEMSARTERNRIVMGRKGLGKLAGFGIAHVIEIVSKVATESHATRITLDLDALLNPQPAATTDEGQEESSDIPSKQTHVIVPVETLADGGGLTKGTRIVLKRLVNDAVRGDLNNSLQHALAENFYGIATTDFAIKINGVPVDTSLADFAYAFPDPDDLPATSLVEHTLSGDGGSGSINFSYRIRFRPSKKQLPAKSRGVRVYAHHRLASVPDLLDVKSSAHGFQYTSYLDGVVNADFIDDQPTDYISTDRQSLRWDTPILAPLREFLTSQMTKALAQYANSVSKGLEITVRKDAFTVSAIAEGKLAPHREKTAWLIARTLADKDGGNLESDFYQNTIKSVISGLGHGEILATIQALSESEKPELTAVIRELTRLTKHEFDEFMTIIDARLRAIIALSKLVEGVDFRVNKNERELHVLFRENAWLIDPTFFEFLTSDKEENELAVRLAKDLKIGSFVPSDYDSNALDETKPLATNLRPDLTFLLSNTTLRRLVIVELKAPNTPLHVEHLTQLQGYMASADMFVKAHPEVGSLKIEGLLIGSRDSKSTSKKVINLNYRIENEMGPNCPWRVFDILEILHRTQNAHTELLATYKKASVAPILKAPAAPPAP
jgi:hypothetical protein